MLMPKSFFVILTVFICILSSCTTSENIEMQNDFDEIFADFEALEGTVYMGISGPYTDQEKGMKVALENAMTMAALSRELRMRADVDMRTDDSGRRDSTYFDVYSSGGYSSQAMMDVVDNYSVVSTSWYGGEIGAAVFIICTDEDQSPIKWNHEVSWLEESVEYPGYVFATGTVDEYYYIQDSINAAAYEAATNLVLNHSSTLMVVNEIVQNTTYSMDVDSYQIGVGILKGFKVLAYKYDAIDRTFSALVGAEI